jgi:hypothetical protein
LNGRQARSPWLVTADLLRLRRWTTSVLSRIQPADEVTRAASAVPASEWNLFLRLERCASALLSVAASTEKLPPAIQETLRQAAALETQSVLRARVDARDIAAIAKRVPYRITVLKGGVRAIENVNPALPVSDIDLLVEKQDVTSLVTELERAGFGKASRALDHHQAIEPSADRLAVEVHWTTHDDGTPLDSSIWHRIRPLPSAPPLTQLGAGDTLLHLIEHATIVHRERSVSLRDTILIGSVAAQCTDDELASVRRSIGAHDQQSQMTSLLDFAIALDKPGAGVVDPFVESCATFYACAAIENRLPAAMSSRSALAFVTEVELGRIPRFRAIRNALRWRGTGVESLADFSKRYPRMAPALIAPAHLAYYALVTAVTLPMIRSTRRKALSELNQRTT